MNRLQGRRARVVVAMSGGVDSSTTAALLHEQGHEVIGLMMKLHDQGGDGGKKDCCGLDEVSDARRVAAQLGIPFYVSDYQQVFQRAVMDAFVEDYLAGRTPNPCVRCNDAVKFKPLLARARKLGADFLATGHYVRTRSRTSGEVDLLRARDASKDQSYFVAGIAGEALSRVVFPLGDMEKSEVRGHALRLGLAVADKAESQDVCFVPDGDYAAFVQRQAPARTPGPGPVVSLDGMRLGQHRGVHRYTVGQRRGLGLAAAEPWYVVGVDAASDTVVVGKRDDVLAAGLVALKSRWIHEAPTVGQRVIARVRHRHAGAEAQVAEVDGERIRLNFETPVSAVSPGQQLVLYDGDVVLGAATIESSIARERNEESVVAHG